MQDDMDQGVVEPPTQKKRRHDDEGQDPPLNFKKQKKRRKRKDVEPSKNSSTSKESSKGKIPLKTSKTRKYVTTEETVEEHVQEVPMDLEVPTVDDVVNNDDQPQDDVALSKDNTTWFKQPPRPPTPDPEWNKDKVAHDGPKQTWLQDLVNAEKPPLTFEDQMSTPIDFSASAMNRLKIDKLTKADLVGPVYKLLKGTYKSSIELEYNMDQCYNALTD
ncbi:hypothetical protein Tco_1139859 [Tanacetum coccineum]